MNAINSILIWVFLQFSWAVIALDVPGAPFLDLTVLSQSSIYANFSPPLSDGGSAINSYKVEWDTDPGVQEVQSITTSVYLGPNEIQSITTSATDINAVQTVGVFATAVPEVQKVTISNSQSGYFFLELNTNNTGGSDQYSGYIYQNYPANNNGGATYGKDVASILSSMPNISPFGTVTVSKQTIDSNNFAS